ncbi:MAG: S8 family serine peptidase, partial [Deltaproteobacteria bacterium]|nr:S8 family serine peptidase [Deltaproteobacteria bacterium]
MSAISGKKTAKVFAKKDNFIHQMLSSRGTSAKRLPLVFVFPLLISLLVIVGTTIPAMADDPCPSTTCDGQYYSQFGPYSTKFPNLDYINAWQAYELGFTGYGIRVGVIDSNFSDTHRELIGRSTGVLVNTPITIVHIMQGVHVGGTIAASRTILSDAHSSIYGSGMQGVAYEASIYTAANYLNYDGELSRFLDPTLSDIKVINNSWGYSKDSSLISMFSADGNVNTNLISYIAQNVDNLLSSSDVLLVFAAGNDGLITPNIPAALPSLFYGSTLYTGSTVQKLITTGSERIGTNIISVMNFNPIFNSTSISFINPETNLADGADWYSLLAPGTSVISTIPYTTSLENPYGSLTGTSVAAPHVAGVAALVQQAFYGIEGKLIGDILLTTAKKLTLADLPPFIIKR